MLDSLRKAFGQKTRCAAGGDFPLRHATHPADVTDCDFAVVVLESALPAVVDVWADWCQPCQIMSAYIDMLAQDYTGRLLVTALDADENPTVTERYQSWACRQCCSCGAARRSTGPSASRATQI